MALVTPISPLPTRHFSQFLRVTSSESSGRRDCAGHRSTGHAGQQEGPGRVDLLRRALTDDERLGLAIAGIDLPPSPATAIPTAPGGRFRAVIGASRIVAVDQAVSASWFHREGECIVIRDAGKLLLQKSRSPSCAQSLPIGKPQSAYGYDSGIDTSAGYRMSTSQLGLYCIANSFDRLNLEAP
jgi:hypothetical protein